MDIFFTDPTEIPLPPSDVKFRQLQVTPQPGKTRLQVTIEIDPFQKRPNIDLAVVNTEGQEVASSSIIEIQSRKMEVILHLRLKSVEENLRLTATLYYAEIEQPETGQGVIEKQAIDSREVVFQL